MAAGASHAAGRGASASMARANSSGTSALTRAVSASSATVPTIRRRSAGSASPQKILRTRRSAAPRSIWPVLVVSQRAQLTRQGSSCPP